MREKSVVNLEKKKSPIRMTLNNICLIFLAEDVKAVSCSSLWSSQRLSLDRVTTMLLSRLGHPHGTPPNLDPTRTCSHSDPIAPEPAPTRTWFHPNLSLSFYFHCFHPQAESFVLFSLFSPTVSGVCNCRQTPAFQPKIGRRERRSCWKWRPVLSLW